MADTPFLNLTTFAREAGFQHKVAAAAVKTAIGYLSGGTPTADQITFAKKVVLGTYNAEQVALAVLMSTTIPDSVDLKTVADATILTQVGVVAGALGKGWS